VESSDFQNLPPLKKYLGDSPDEYAFTKWQISESLKQAGFGKIQVIPYEFLHPSTPVNWIERVIKFEDTLSKTFIQQIGGSLLVEAVKS
jgi:hypothetical protein